MNNLIKAEETSMFLLSIFLFAQLDFAWWWFPALLLLPDIGMIGYLAGPKSGAISYNLFHHKGIAVLVFLAGIYFTNEWVQLAGIILFAHAAMDRLFGYGLKYFTGFQHTHLGMIGKAEKVKA